MAAALRAELVCSSRWGGVMGSGWIDSYSGGIEVGRDGEIGVNNCGLLRPDVRDIMGRSSIAGCENECKR